MVWIDLRSLWCSGPHKTINWTGLK